MPDDFIRQKIVPGSERVNQFNILGMYWDPWGSIWSSFLGWENLVCIEDWPFHPKKIFHILPKTTALFLHSEINVLYCVGSIVPSSESDQIFRTRTNLLWRRAYARNVRLRFLYQQYINLFFFELFLTCMKGFIFSGSISNWMLRSGIFHTALVTRPLTGWKKVFISIS